MKGFAILIFILLFFKTGFANKTVDNLLVKLDGIIENREYFVKQKELRIDTIKQNYLVVNTNDTELYNYYLELSEEYQSFKFDSAFYYTNKLIGVAYNLAEPNKIARAKIEFANILISSGMFNESIDTLRSVELENLNNETLAR